MTSKVTTFSTYMKYVDFYNCRRIKESYINNLFLLFYWWLEFVDHKVWPQCCMVIDASSILYLVNVTYITIIILSWKLGRNVYISQNFYISSNRHVIIHVIFPYHHGLLKSNDWSEFPLFMDLEYTESVVSLVNQQLFSWVLFRTRVFLGLQLSPLVTFGIDVNRSKLLHLITVCLDMKLTKKETCNQK